MNKSNLLFATLMAGAVSGMASDSFGMVPYAPRRSRNGRAKGHRNGSAGKMHKQISKRRRMRKFAAKSRQINRSAK